MYGQPTGWQQPQPQPPPQPQPQPQPPRMMAPQMTGFAPGGMLPQQTGMPPMTAPLQQQMTAMPPLQQQQTAVPGRPGAPPMFSPPPPHSMHGGLMPPLQPMPTGLMPQQTGLRPPGMPPSLQSQQTGMPMRPQQTGMPMGPQMTGMPMPPQMTGMPLRSQQTGMPLGPQPTGMLGPQQTGMPMMGQPTGMMGPMDPRMRMMALQFLPASVAAPAPGMFSSGAVQPDQFAAALAASAPALGPQKTGMAPRRDKKAMPYKLASDEKKSYEAIFRSWDPKRTGFLDGSLAREVFGQAGLSNDELMSIWTLADTDNRGKLNIAEFQVAMGLIYRALNGNEIPAELPKEMVPTSSRDLNESVDFLKELLTRDASVRAATGINLPLPGRIGTPGKESSLYQDPLSRSSGSGRSTPRTFGQRAVGEAAAYKNDDANETPVYRSAARHINRSAVRFKGQQPDSELDDLRAQLARTQALVDSSRDGGGSVSSLTPTSIPEEEEQVSALEREETHLVREKTELEQSVEADQRALASGQLSAEEQTNVADRRRKTERQLIRVAHQQLPLIRERLSWARERASASKNAEARKRDSRNAKDDPSARFDRYTSDRSASDRRPSSGWDKYSSGPTSDSGRSEYSQALSERDSALAAPSVPPSSYSVERDNFAAPRTGPSVPPSVSPSASRSRAPSAGSASTPPPPSGPERTQWLREQAQKKVRERMAALGLTAPSEPSPSASPASGSAPPPARAPTPALTPAPAAAPAPRLETEKPVPDPEALAQQREAARAARRQAEEVALAPGPAPGQQPLDTSVSEGSRNHLAPTNPFARLAESQEHQTPVTGHGVPADQPAPGMHEEARPSRDILSDDDEEQELARREAELEARRAARLASASSSVSVSAPVSAPPEHSNSGAYEDGNGGVDEEERELARLEAEMAARRAARLAAAPAAAEEDSSGDEDEGPEELDAPSGRAAAYHYPGTADFDYPSGVPHNHSEYDERADLDRAAAARFPEL